MRRTELRWVERSLINQQISGEHAFPAFHDLDLDWQYTFGKGSREAPDRRIYLFEQEGNGFTFPLRSDNNVRLFEDMDNFNHDLSTDLSIPLPIEQLQKTSFKTGFKLVDKSRDSDIRRFTFEDVATIPASVRNTNSLEDILNEENIGSNGFQILEVTRPSDSYEADQTILAYYAMADVRINDHFGVTGGARVESSDQELESRNLFGETIKPDLETDDVFPAVSGTWFVGGRNDTKLRLAFSETINRPDFKELSPAPFIDPVTRLNVVGNPELEETSIQNLDLRFEHFFSDSENVAVSLFYKNFDQPIERIQELGPAQTSTFINSDQAENYGVELEALKYLGFLHERLSNFYLGGNLALIESEVTLDEEQKGELTNTERALQGQSDWVLNLNAGYENPDRGIVANLLFNMSGERISQLGTRGRPDIKKQPVPRLDFVYSQELFEAWKLKFEAANLLDPDIEFEQGSNLTRSHQEGREFSLQVEYTFR
jgi:TonB-dependent receptor